MHARDEIREMVISCLSSLVSNPSEVEINDATDPTEDLRLDSEDGVEFACDISIRMGRHFPDDLNPFVDDERQEMRSVGEIVELLVELQSDLAEAVVESVA